VKVVLIREPATVDNVATHLSDATSYDVAPLRDGDKIAERIVWSRGTATERAERKANWPAHGSTNAIDPSPPLVASAPALDAVE